MRNFWKEHGKENIIYSVTVDDVCASLAGKTVSLGITAEQYYTMKHDDLEKLTHSLI